MNKVWKPAGNASPGCKTLPPGNSQLSKGKETLTPAEGHRP